MPKIKKTKADESISRRYFLKSSLHTGIGLAMAGPVGKFKSLDKNSIQKGKKPQELNVAFIGVGAQGRVLIESCLRIPGIHIKAVCDIWEYSQIYAQRYLKKYGQEVNVYEDYRQMLGKEKNLDAVIVASPDWVHARHTNACLQAGYHVYCEKEMSNSLAQAKSMVQTARQTGRLLQIGHQRRSNPRYLHAINTLIQKKKLLGRVGQAYAQWNRSKSDMLGWPKKYTIEPQKLAQYGYDSMAHLRNWRWYKKYGGGPIVDLGSHQIDLFGWVFGVNPSTVVASGGIDYYKNREWFDNVMVIFEFKNRQDTSRALYQVQTTTKHGGFYESFMGENGSLVLSEIPQKGNWAMREAHAPEWNSLVKEGLLESETAPLPKVSTQDIFVDVRVTVEAGRWPLPIELVKPAHQPHLENFFAAILHQTPLNCPAEIGYECAVAVLKVNEAVKARKLLQFRAEEFKV